MKSFSGIGSRHRLRSLLSYAAVTALLSSCLQTSFTMVSTTEGNPWVENDVYDGSIGGSPEDLVVDLEAVGQTIKGFGTCFSELSHRALSKLSPEDYDALMTELFAPGGGMEFTICRMPVGSSDFALKYYSFNDTPGDLAMEHFSIGNDKERLIPLIKDALAKNPSLKIWGSPWCPPSWMKVNHHYASRPLKSGKTASPGRLELDNVIKDNGLDDEHTMHEGEDSFIQDEEYFKAYALYFQKYIRAYREEGIDIFMVMPQNEFNSDQNFPSCTWTVRGLVRFLHHLVPAMKEEGVEVYFGTMERPDRAMVDTVLTDPLVGGDIKGVAFQWAGKAALPLIHESYPGLTMVMSEQQCFGGANSWKDFMAAWELLKYNLDNGVAIYDYWNLALFDKEVSTWGWQQNSLISVDYETGSYTKNYEFYEMKHISHYVKPGAVYLGTKGSLESAMAFRNPDGSIVVLAAEKTGHPKDLTIRAGRRTVRVNLPASSVNTIVID